VQYHKILSTDGSNDILPVIPCKGCPPQFSISDNLFGVPMKKLLKRIFDRIPAKLRSRLYVLIKQPGYFLPAVRPDTPFWASSYFHIMKTFHWREARQQRKIIGSISTSSSLEIKGDDGFLLFDLSSLRIAEDAIRCCEEVVKNMPLGKMESEAKKPFLLQEDLRPDNPKMRPVFDLACDPVLLKPITEYLGVAPALHSAQIWISPNKHRVAGRSQDFHFDGEDKKQVKCFINIEEVSEEAGPFTLIPAKRSMEVYQRLKNSGSIDRRNEKVGDNAIGAAGGGGKRQYQCLGRKGNGRHGRYE
jgi:hypothetical protein